MQTKDETIKQLERKAIDLTYADAWACVIELLEEQEQHEYYWLAEGRCVYDNLNCEDCRVLECQWSAPQYEQQEEKTNEHYMFILYMGMVF